MNWRRLVIVVVLALGIALLMLWPRLPAVVESTVISKLESLGASGVNLVVSEVGFATSRVAELRFLLERGGQRYTVSAPAIDVSYTLPGLLGGHIDSVSVQGLTVRLATLSVGQVGSDDGMPLNAGSIRFDWLASVPVNAVTLNGARVDLPGENGSTRFITADGELTFAPGSAKARLAIRVVDDSKQLQLDAPLEVALTSNTLMLQVGEGARATLKNNKLADISVKSLGATLLSDARCGYDVKGNDWSCEAFALDLAIPLISHPQIRVTTKNGKLDVSSLTGSGSDWSANLAVDFPPMQIDSGTGEAARQIKLDRLHGSIAVSNNTLDAKLAVIALAGEATLQLEATHDLQGNKGQARYHLEPINLQQHGSVLADSYSGWPVELLVNAGSIALNGKLAWQQGVLLPSQQATASLTNVGGVHGKIRFSGLSTVLDASGVDELHVKTRQGLTLARLDIGTAITNTRLQADLRWQKGRSPTVLVKDLDMGLLGGKFSSPRIALDLGRERNPFSLQVSGVDVEALLELEEKQGLFGTGILDGELPLVLTPEGISMQDGQLIARRPGGKLRYRANEGVLNLARKNAGVELLVTAMKDFTYKLLEADVDYSPDGLLKMKVRLEGSNPELERGRPVHLNVNVEDNILELLRSLRLAEEIGGKIGEQLQKRQTGK